MLQALRILPLLLATLILRTDRKILRRLREAAATDPQRAIQIERGGVIWNWRLDRLNDFGALGQALPGWYYLDEARWNAYRRKRRGRMLTVLAVLLLVVLLFAWKGWI